MTRRTRRILSLRPPEELDAILRSPRMFEVTVVGGIGLAVIIGLMVIQPF